MQTLREIERIVCAADPADSGTDPLLHVGGIGSKRSACDAEEAALRRDFDAAVRAGTLSERDQMIAAIQQPKLISDRTEVMIKP